MAADELYLGLISGTSADGVDAVLAAIDDHRCEVLAACTTPFPEGLAARLGALLANPQVHLAELGRLDVALGSFFAECALRVLGTASRSPEDVTAIGHHGQTIFHDASGAEPFTMQIGDPNVVASRTGITTVADFRRLDVAFGGQGAPLVPAFHDWCFREPDEARAVVNIGGIANVTLLAPRTPVTGFDTGPGNTLLDHWIRRHRGVAFDDGGSWAASGQVDPRLLARLLADPYFARPAPKSTGPEHFNLDWLESRSGENAAAAAADIQATLAELSAMTIAGALKGRIADCRRLIVCGGGAHNADLIARLARLAAPIVVEDSAVHGIAPDWVEGAAFAWLARRRLRKQSGNVPSVTGARRAAVLGSVYCGDHGHEHAHDQSAHPGRARPG
jgi:anhydro-N-acetylmuramic acid kinase